METGFFVLVIPGLDPGMTMKRRALQPKSLDV
jgi:hypothetical protein